jgi:hypothetical protein
MSATAAMGLNEDHTPGDAEEAVLGIFKQEREHYGESRMTPQLIRDRLDGGQSRQSINYALGQLVAAGWVRKLTDGLYEFVEDPRE